MTELKKILIMMPSMRGGGAERVLINLLNGVDYERFAIELIAFEYKGELWDQVPDKVIKRCLKIPALPRKIGVYIYRRYGIDILIKYYASLIKGHYHTGLVFLDSVYTQCMHDSSAKFDNKYIVIHSSYSSYGLRSRFIKGKHYHRMKRRYEQSDGIISVAKEALLEWRKLFGFENKSCFIYNPMNNKRVLQKSEEKLRVPADERFKFIAIGGLIPVKDFSLLIQAAKLLKDKQDNFRVDILGKGILEKQLHAEIKTNQLEDHVYLRGFQPNPYNWLKCADAFVMTSQSEGLPTVLCESMLLAVPAIVPNITGCREVSDQGKYAVQYERNANNLALEMERIMTEPQRRDYFTGQAKERAKIFDDYSAIQSYEALFNGNMEKACTGHYNKEV